MSSLKAGDGEITADNRAPGTPVPGFRSNFVQMATMYCYHCGGHVIPRRDRIRPREYCRTCNHYICDGCAAVAAKPNYAHRTIDDLTEMVCSGRFRIVGGTVCDPVLIPTGVT